MGFSKQEYWSGLPFPSLDFPGGSDGKASVYNVGDPGSIPGLGRSPGEGNGNPLLDYCLPGSSVHGVLQARILEWVAISCSTQQQYQTLKVKNHLQNTEGILSPV